MGVLLLNDRVRRMGCSNVSGRSSPPSIEEFAMQLSAGDLIRVTCTNVLDYPHDGIVSVSYNKAYTASDTASVLADVRVIHFCKGDPDHAGGAPLDELRVRETSLAWFVAHGKAPCIVGGPPSPYSPQQVVHNARSKLGAAEYKPHKRNCQSFATHCYYGVAVSEAVLRVGYTVAAALLALTVAVVYATEKFARTPWAR
jgi:hypothetical protein